MSRDRLLALLNASPLTTEQRKQVFTDFRDAADYRDFSQRLSQTLRTPATARLGYDISRLFKEMQPTNPDGTNVPLEEASIQAVAARYPVPPETEQPSMLDRALRVASVSPIIPTDEMRATAEQKREQLGQEYVERAARGETPSLLERLGREALITARYNLPAEAADVLTNPAQLLAKATGLGGAISTALNVQRAAQASRALSNVNRAVQSGLDVAQMASGVTRAATSDSPEDRFGGLAQAALGATGLAVTRRPELAQTALRDVPQVLRQPSTAELTAKSIKNLSAWQRANKAGRQKTTITPEDWSQHVEPALALYMQDRKIDPSTITNAEIAEAMRWYVGRIESDFDSISAANPNVRARVDVNRVKDALAKKFSELPVDRKDALAVVETEFPALRNAKTLGQLTALRQQLSGKLSDMFGKSGSQQYYATQASAAKAAYDALLDEVRDTLFRTYDQMGVSTTTGNSAQEARRSIRSAIQVRDRTELSKELGQQQVGPLPKTLGQSVLDNVARNSAFLAGFTLAGGASNPVVGATAGYTAREAVKNAIGRMRGETMTRDDIARAIAESVGKNVTPAGRPIAPATPPPSTPPPPVGPVYSMTRTETGAPSVGQPSLGGFSPAAVTMSATRAGSPDIPSTVAPDAPVSSAMAAPEALAPRMDDSRIAALEAEIAALQTERVAAEATAPAMAARIDEPALAEIEAEAQRVGTPEEAQQIQAAVQQLRAEAAPMSPAMADEGVALQGEASPIVARPREAVPVAMAEPTPAQQLLDEINQRLARGENVVVKTMTKATTYTPKVAASYSNANRPLFKLGKDGNLYVARGKQYDQLTMGGDTLMVGVSDAQGRPVIPGASAAASESASVDPTRMGSLASEAVEPAPVREAAPSTPVVTPATAATQVNQELARVIDVEGAKTGAEVQRRVIAALQDELGAVRSRMGAYRTEWGMGTAQKAYTDNVLMVYPQGDDAAPFALAVDKDGNIVGRNGEFFPKAEQESLRVPGETVMPRKNDTRITRAPVDTARNNLEAAAAQYLAGESGKMTVQIPGDGTFTINRTPFALEEMIRRVSKAGPQAWRLSSEMKAGAPLSDKPKAAVKAGIGADAPGKKIPFVAATTRAYDPETSGSIVAEFIDFPLMPTHRFVVGKLPTGWAVFEYSTGKSVSSAASSKAKAIEQAFTAVAALKNPQQALESEVVKYPVLNTAFPARREE